MNRRKNPQLNVRADLWLRENVRKRYTVWHSALFERLWRHFGIQNHPPSRKMALFLGKVGRFGS
jgi:hypothetical protein